MLTTVFIRSVISHCPKIQWNTLWKVILPADIFIAIKFHIWQVNMFILAWSYFFFTVIKQSGEKPIPILHTAPSQLSGDVNKKEKHKSNLDVHVATALVSHAAQDWSNKLVKILFKTFMIENPTWVWPAQP